MKTRYELTLIAIGCIIYALSMTMIEPIELIPGSFLGIAVALHKLFDTPSGAVNLLLNIPVMILCAKIFGKKTLYYTILIMAATSVLIDLFSIFAPDKPYMNGAVIALTGGFVMGVGAGLLLAAGGTMAGTTALSKIINQKFPRLSVGNILILLDMAVILTGCAILRSVSALLYSVLYTLACSKTIDLVIFLVKRGMENGSRIPKPKGV